MKEIKIKGEVYTMDGAGGADVWTDDKQEMCMILSAYVGKKVEVIIKVI